jgi:hypothetical protein
MSAMADASRVYYTEQEFELVGLLPTCEPEAALSESDNSRDRASADQFDRPTARWHIYGLEEFDQVASPTLLVRKETPRLCRGGSRSLTYPGVHP